MVCVWWKRREKAGVPAAEVKPGTSALPSEWTQRSFLNTPSARGEVCSGNSSDKPEAVMKQGEYSWQGNQLAGCSTWLFDFDLIRLRSFLHLNVMQELVLFTIDFRPPSPPASCG